MKSQYKNINQNGFSAVVYLIAVVVLSVIGFAGWRVINNEVPVENMSEPVVTEEVDIASDNISDELSEEKNMAPTEIVKKSELVIFEWGVKIPLSDLVGGAYYKVTTDFEQSATDPESLTVYTQESDNLVGPAGITCRGEYIAYLIRLPIDDSRWQPQKDITDDNVSELFGKRTDIGNYRYAIATKKQYGPECFIVATGLDTYTPDEATMQKFNEITDTFESDFSAITSL